MKYYKLTDDINYPQRWYLGDVVGVEDNWIFVYGQFVNKEQLPKNLSLQLWKQGIPMDYTTNEAYSVPIVSGRLHRQLGGVKGVQFISVRIEEYEDLEYFIMVVSDKIDCVDELNSVFGKFVENDPVRPDLAGHYRWFTDLKIDKSKVGSKDIFRIDRTVTNIIVSERVKVAMEDIGTTGAQFIEV